MSCALACHIQDIKKIYRGNVADRKYLGQKKWGGKKKKQQHIQTCNAGSYNKTN